jgi:hypothetical protein
MISEQHRGEITFAKLPWTMVRKGDVLEDPHVGRVRAIAVGRLYPLSGRLVRNITCTVHTIGAGEVVARMETRATDRATIMYPRWSIARLGVWARTISLPWLSTIHFRSRVVTRRA